MSSTFPNNLYHQVAAGKLCTAFGIRLVTSPVIVQIARLAGFNSLFIELEHSTLSIDNASSLCTTALLAGITPFVRVPHKCGDGFVQRILDGGAMGVIVPHIHNAQEAQAAVRICKYPPEGSRSMTGQLPQFSLVASHPDTVISQSNSTGSAVMLMIETRDSVDNIDEIAQVTGADVLLIGSNDLSIELGVPGQFDGELFKSALRKVSQAAKRHGKVFGLAGIYDRKDYHDFAVNELGARFLLAQQDSGLLAKSAKACAAALEGLQEARGGPRNSPQNLSCSNAANTSGVIRRLQ